MTTPVQVAQALTAIEKLYTDLEAQAIHKASDRLMPGGEAMVALAPVGSPEGWAENVAAVELFHLSTCPKIDHTRCTYTGDDGSDGTDDEPVLQTLLFWSEQWRAGLGYTLERRPTVTTEAAFIRHRIDWAYEQPDWGDFAKDILKARTRLENLLSAGERAERGAPCIYDNTTLTRRHEPYRDEEGRKAWRLTPWFCPKCHRSWDEDAYARMVTAASELTKVEPINGDDWVSLDYAARKIGRPLSTLRVWIHRGELALACIITGRRERFVNLTEVQQRHERSTRRPGNDNAA